MKKKTLIFAVLTLTLLCIGYVVIYGLDSSVNQVYQFAAVSRGDIETTVSATGTLSPVTTVEVGTQISGTIDSIYVDFNEQVTTGQILAVLDTTLLKASVLDAEASVERAQAELEEAQFEESRNRTLFERKLISESAYLPYNIGLKTAKAVLKSALAAKQRADQNLQYAVIRSPISGVVISRNVEGGQTVAASLSTPTLFAIAQDLVAMEILTEVDESDIGQIQEGQQVRFEVAAYQDLEFEGTVKQVRLQPQTVSNVVTYTAVVEARNADGLLLPGMTATVEFVTERHTDVLFVPSKALRYVPSQDQLVAFREQQSQVLDRPVFPDNTSSPVAASRTTVSHQPSANAGMIWYVDSTGQLSGAPLRTGLSDGTRTEILASRALVEGMQIVVSSGDVTSNSTRTNQAQPSGSFRGPGVPM